MSLRSRLLRRHIVTKTNSTTEENLRTILGMLKYPVISDKATRLLELNKYTFMVDKRANKFTIKKIIEYIFDVDVINVNKTILGNTTEVLGEIASPVVTGFGIYKIFND